MIKLSHLIYCSTANHAFSDEELAELLDKARSHNISINVTGMLLYENGSFFQVVEGPPDTIEALYKKISSDTRHSKVISIIHEPIVKRTFAEWTMGYTRVSAKEVAEIVGLNDFFTNGNSLNQLDSNRAKKLLAAFKEGRWRARIQSGTKRNIKLKNDQLSEAKALASGITISSAFQPIINSRSKEIIAYEAIPCDLSGKILDESTLRNYESQSPNFDSNCRISAISLANRLNINCYLTFAFRAEQVSNAHTAISSMVDAANDIGISPSGIILKVNQDNLMGEPDLFARMIQEFRGAGLTLAIDNFGTGRASLNLLETYHPDFISLSSLLVTGVDSNGARQAIIRGVNQTCNDLGIDVIANHVSSFAEFEWFNDEGITLFQGDLIAKPAFEQLPTAFIPVLNDG